MNQRWRLYQKVDGVWEPVPGAEWNGYPESEVKNKVWSKYGREALDTGEYQLVNMGEQDWEVYDVNTGKTLEIVKGKSKGEVADQVYDKYVDQGIGFQVRPYVDPATLTPRAKLAKRIAEPKEKGDWDVIYKPTGRVIDNILRVDREQAEKLLKQVAVLHDFENADNLEIRPQDLTKAADNTEPGDWEFYRTETGNVIDRVSNASKMQANAVRADIVRRYGHPDTSVGMRRVDQQAAEPGDMSAFERNSDRIEAIRAQQTQPTGTTYQIFRTGQPSAMNTFQAATHPEAMERLEQFRRNHPSTPPHEFSLINLPVNESLANTLINLKSGPWTIMEDSGPVEVRKSRMFDQTLADRVQQLPNLPDRIQEFLSFKMANPGQPWGKDTPFTAAGPLARALPKLRHVHLTRDLSLFYTIGGRDPAVIRLYGVFSHADSGTGTPGNINRQRSLARQLDNQFESAVAEDDAVQVKDLVAAVARLEAELKTNMFNFDRKEYYRKKNLIRQYKKNIQNLIAQHGTMAENFADGKGPGRPGDSQRHGIPKHATMAELERASHSKGRKGQLARWQLNMRRGKKK